MKKNAACSLLSAPALALALALPPAGTLRAAEEVRQWRFEPEAPAGKVEGTIRLVEGDDEAPPHAILNGQIVLSRDAAEARLPVDAITVEAWVQIDEAGDWGGFLGAIQDNGTHERGWVLGYNGRRFVFGLTARHPGRVSYLRSSETFVRGAWYHVAATYDGSEQRIYVDGRLSAADDQPSGPILQPDSLYFVIGAYRDDNDNWPFSGRMESVAMWSRALSGEEIAQRFAGRKSGFANIEGSESSDRGEPGDWVTWQGDNLRSGVANRALDFPLSATPAWIHTPRRPLRAAWPETAQSDYWRKRDTPEKPRVTFDWCHDVVVAGDSLYYGSASDDALRCLDAKTGKLRWEHVAGGPVRLAPTLSHGAVVFGCDDGCVYALDAATGKLRWKSRPPSAADERLPGNGRMMNFWPVRTGVLAIGDTGYFGAGLFPEEGGWYCSIDLRDGRILDEKVVEHSMQGYLVEREGRIHVPTGRAPGGVDLSDAERKARGLDPPPGQVAVGEFSLSRATDGMVTFAGGRDSVAAFDNQTGERLWEAEVDAPARGLAIASGHLYVSTESGRIYAFGSKPGDSRTPQSAPAIETPELTDRAERLLALVPKKRGYVLVIGGVGSGELIHQLAAQSEFHIIGVSPDQEWVRAARLRLAGAGVYGDAVIQEVESLDRLPFVDGLFNLIVCGNNPDTILNPAETQRLLQPYDGVALVGGNQIRCMPPAGAGAWTHAYADPGNTASSGDQLVRGDFRLQWFGAPGPHHMIDRHLRGSPPVARDGFLAVPGRDYLFGIDAFNGAVLWEREIADFTRVAMLRDSGNLALGPDRRLYVASGARCLAIDTNSGEEVRQFGVDVDTEEWGYLARVSGSGFGSEPGELLIGSAVVAGGVRRELGPVTIFDGGYGDGNAVVCSRRLFALDPESGAQRWQYRPGDAGGAILNPTLGMADGRVFFVESRNSETLGGTGRWNYDALLEGAGADLRCLDLQTGSQVWRKPIALEKNVQTLYLCSDGGRVVMAGSRNAAGPKEKATLHYDIQVFSAATGAPIWKHSFDTGRRSNLIHGEQDLHPVIVGDRLVVERRVFALADGKPLLTVARKHGGGCGSISASADRLFYRSRYPCSFDFESQTETPITRVSRPGCWINMIPASGLLLVPEGSSGCICSFPVQASLAFRPVARDRE